MMICRAHAPRRNLERDAVLAALGQDVLGRRLLREHDAYQQDHHPFRSDVVAPALANLSDPAPSGDGQPPGRWDWPCNDSNRPRAS
eukprot:12752096-Alexandrium_andersonii.AAC.1